MHHQEEATWHAIMGIKQACCMRHPPAARSHLDCEGIGFTNDAVGVRGDALAQCAAAGYHHASCIMHGRDLLCVFACLTSHGLGKRERHRSLTSDS